MSDLEDLVRRGDPSELLLEVDRRSDQRDWDGLLALRDRCNQAIEHGRQLWSVAQFVEYRLALEAPGEYAADVCRTGAGRFALGPLTEVAASTHEWEELADHLGEPWVAATVAQERVLRGEDLRGDARTYPAELGLPLTLFPWEPDYPLPVYRSHDLVEGGPPAIDPSRFGEATGDDRPPADRPDLRRALLEVASTWAEASNGGCVVAAVEGDAVAAAHAVFGSPVELAPTEIGEAVSRLAWTAASGGAYGRRRGMAAGRSSALWVLHAATGIPSQDGMDRLDAALERLRWFAVAEPDVAGWRLRLAFEHDEGWSAAIDAWDHRIDDRAL